MKGERPRSGPSIVYCIVPAELSGKLLDPLREHFRDDPAVEVIVERRGAERRAAERRDAAVADEEARRRRRVRAEAGRRVADRRAPTVVAAPPQLPRKAARCAERLTFVSRQVPSDQTARDVETERLVLRFQGGESGAAEELYLSHFDTVYGYARIALREQGRAEEVTRRAFALATQSATEHQPAPGEPFRARLLRIAREVILEAIGERGAGRVDAGEDAEESGAATSKPGAGLGSGPALEWLSDKDVSFFVERLPDYQREVLVLHYLLGETSERAAEVLDLPADEVREMLARALATLETKLRDVDSVAPRSSDRAMMVARRRTLPVVAARRGSLAVQLHPAGALRSSPARP